MGLTTPTTVNFDGKRGFSTPDDGVSFVPDDRGVYHLPKLKQGSTIEFDVEFPDPANAGALVVLTALADVEYEADFRANYSDAAPEITATFTNPTTTSLRVRVEATATSTLAAEEDDGRPWDLEIKYNDGGSELHVERIIQGTYQYTREASK